MNKLNFKVGQILATVVLTLAANSAAWAAVPILATEPLATTSSSVVVRPNILFTLDDSGSMGDAFLPDYTGSSSRHCKSSVVCENGMPPFQAAAYNGMAYNPQMSYPPAQNYDGSYKVTQNSANTSGWTAVKKDGLRGTTTVNLTTGYPDMVYCDSNSGGVCKQNGIDTSNPFFEDVTGTGNPPSFAFPGNLSVPSSTVVSVTSNLFTGTLYGVTTTQQTVYSGTPALTNGSPYATTITLSHSSSDVAKSGSTVTLTYTGQNPTSPLIATGDLITTGGGGCGSKYTASTSVSLTLGSAGQLTYSVTGGGGTSSRNCDATVIHTTTPTGVPPPSISSDGTTVTVKLSTAHGLVSGDVLTIANGAATCDAGYRATNVTATVVDSTTFTYPAAAVLGTAGNTSCKITKAVYTQPNAPGISIAGNVVTVQLTGHGLVSGDVIQVTGASCGSAFRTITTPGVSVTVSGANAFTYTSTTPTGSTGLVCSIDKVTGMASIATAYTNPRTQNGAPYEYVIIPVEFCDSAYLTNCVAASAPTVQSGVSYSYPAPVRFCSSNTIAALPPGSSGAQISSGTIRCQGKFSNVSTVSGVTVPTYTSVRYGLFYRVDIVPSRTTYGNEVLNATINVNGISITFNNVTVIDRSTRNRTYTSGGTTYTDCAAAPDCTYDEEMINFANHYAYYRTRMQMMKTAVGGAFNSPLMTGAQALYRLGFVTINFSSTDYLAMGDIDYPVTATGQKDSFYSKLYAISPNGYTPLREAIARAGRYFAGKHGLSNEMTGDPMQYSCQQNYLLITTDGYWNGPSGNADGSTVYDLNSTNTMIGNVDNVDSGLTARSLGVYDGNISGASTTLADVAEYYYENDLRTKTLGNCTDASGTAYSLCPNSTTDTLNNVPTSTADSADWQHMVTFSLGLADGLMLYQSNYAKASSGDFSNIKSGASGCPFSGSGVCNWPLPVSGTQTALDDLWHAAVNGRGAFFNARDPASLASGLAGALAGMQAQTGAASASATSSPNISKTDRAIYSSTYRTQLWDGEVVAQLLDPATAAVPPLTLTTLPIISAISLVGTTVSVTLNSHGLLSGDWIQVANTATGTCDAGFNGGGQSLSVTVTDANHFTYTSLNSGGAVANTGCQISKSGIVWSAQTQLDYKVQQAILTGTDPEISARYIVTLDQAQAHPLDVTGPNGVKEFRYARLTPTETGYFDNQCSSGSTVILSQCTTGNLTAAQTTSANSGTNLVPYLRGQTAMEQTVPNPVYRPRQHFMGDVVNAKPNYVRAPLHNYNDSLPNDTSNSLSYTSFIASNLSRQATLYVAANDGMLHAFDAGGCTGTVTRVCNPGTGSEIWAYVPRMVMPNLYHLADVNYATKHNFFVDGSPETTDIFVDAANATSSGLSQGWHTILVAGLNGGGMGFYALDVTNPQIPIALWETCADKDAAGNLMCTNNDPDMGYSFGNPLITKRSADGRWVVLVTSGYNNIATGNGRGYLYVLDALSGVILEKIPTGSGSTSSPSGLAKINAWVDSSDTNSTARFVYGGDLNGDVWRFDLGAVGSTPAIYPTLSAAATIIASLKDSSGNPQPITTRPELGNVSKVSTINSLTATGKPVIYIGTGQYVFKNDACLTTPQSFYALEDNFGSPTYFNNPQSSTYSTVMVPQTIDAITGASTSNSSVNWDVNGGPKKGWYVNFPTSGERVNLDPFLALGTLFVVTNVPLCSGSTSCINGGVSYLYQFDYLNGNGIDSTVRTLIANSLTVGFEVVRTESGSLKVIAKGSENKQTVKTGKVHGTAAMRGVSWRELVK